MRSLVRRLAAAAMTGTLALSLLAAGASPARAAADIYVTTTNQEINGDAECSLQEAIYSANRDDNTAPDPGNPGSDITTGCAAGSGDDTIYLPAKSVFTFADPITDYDNVMGPTATPMVTSTIIIEGQGARLQRTPLGRMTRAFAVAPDGDLTLHEMDIKGFAVHGGNGAEGGGGGLGAGGAVYVVGGRLGVGWTTFESNVATGGNGGSMHYATGQGGGGGLSGNGGGTTGFDGGGGGGSRGDGADAPGTDGGGGGGTVTSGVGSTPGESCGGEGGVYDTISGGADDGSPGCSGGGGGGGTERVPLFDPFSGGDGGYGGYGGGGGGAGEDADGGHGGDIGGGGGGAGPGANGGDGGFGGGGGSGQELCIPFPCIGSEGAGGTFAGHGGSDGGGGGAALGGAIFGDNATIVIQNSTFSGNSVNHGLAGNSAQNGADGGGAIFAVDGSVNVYNATISGNDSTGSGAGLVMYKSSRGNAAKLRLRNSIVGGNTGRDECFVLGGVSNDGSANNLVTLHDTDIATPCFNINLGDDPALGPLQLNAPGKTPTMALLPGSPAIGGADPATATPDDQRGVSRDAQPDLGAFEFTGQPPVTTITLSPASPDGSNGWYLSPVGVTVNATDADSTVAQTRCDLDPVSVPASFDDLPNAACAIGTVSTDGAHAVYAASVDTENNVEIPVVSATFKIDQTDPVLDPSLSSTTITLNQTGVTASPNATDATSGVASSSCDPVDTSTPGVHTVECTATDNAGNTATQSIDYVVAYRILGFFVPVPGSKWFAGQTVPIKIALADAAGVRIPDADAAALSTSCRVTFSAAGVQPKGPQCLRYDLASRQFIYNWKLGKQPLGSVTITVTVSYPGTTTTTQLSETIVIVKK